MALHPSRAEMLALGRAARRALQGVRDGDGRRLAFCDRAGQLVHAGVGVLVYFWDLRLCALIFLALSVLAFLPVVALGRFVPVLLGSELDDDLTRPSLGAGLNALILENPLSPERQLVLLVATAWMALALRSAQERLATKADIAVDTTIDYAVEVLNCPKLPSAGASTLAEHFSAHFGPVDHVEMGLQSSRVIALRAKWDNFKMTLDDRVARRQGGRLSRALRRKLGRIEALIREAQTCALPTGIAYVVFKTQSSTAACLRAHRLNPCARRAPRFVGRGFSTRLRIRPAPDPSDVLWANLEVSRGRRLLLLLPVTITVTCVIVLAAGVEVLVDTFQPFEEAVVRLMGGALVVFASLFDRADDVVALARSDPTALAIATGQAVALFTGLLVTAVNWVLEGVIEQLAGSEKPSTRTAHERSLFWKLAFAFTLNTSLVPLVSTGPALQWFSPQGAFQKLFFTALTEVVVGTSLRAMQIGSTVVRSVRVWRARSVATVTEAYRPSFWSLGQNYAEASRLVVRCLAFGPLMPLLFPLCAIGLAYQYAVSKRLLLAHLRPTAVVGPQLSRAFYSTLLYGLLLQQVVLLIVDVLQLAPVRGGASDDRAAAPFELFGTELPLVLYRAVLLACVSALDSRLVEVTARRLLPCLFCQACGSSKQAKAIPFAQIKKPARYVCPANEETPTYEPAAPALARMHAAANAVGSAPSVAAALVRSMPALARSTAVARAHELDTEGADAPLDEGSEMGESDSELSSSEPGRQTEDDDELEAAIAQSVAEAATAHREAQIIADAQRAVEVASELDARAHEAREKLARAVRQAKHTQMLALGASEGGSPRASSTGNRDTRADALETGASGAPAGGDGAAPAPATAAAADKAKVAPATPATHELFV
ncbi:hypothetical protein KFE25_013979 [Diacronema lutheri]|uniref:CSC1/OSCA1-like cytosolic domain-containing protein n=1 Tax=Diacronema lutheri TaxID=2081491 RepID=A0A8J6C9U7_DIALT|nr:hypothetical protein KFE25_013979 [Diacronema lutheri]